MLCSVAITASGELVFHLFAALAEFERRVRSASPPWPACRQPGYRAAPRVIEITSNRDCKTSWHLYRVSFSNPVIWISP